MEGPVIIYGALLLFGLIRTARVLVAVLDPLDNSEELRRIDLFYDRLFDFSVGAGAIIFGAGLLVNHMGR